MINKSLTVIKFKGISALATHQKRCKITTVSTALCPKLTKKVIFLNILAKGTCIL